LWRDRTGSAANTPSADEQIVVVVSYEGDVEPLRQAGLAPGFDRPGVASGRIAFRDIERLAAVPSVSYIEMEPEVGALLDGTLNEMRVPWKVPPTDPGQARARA
jgi:hypothetical protein